MIRWLTLVWSGRKDLPHDSAILIAIVNDDRDVLPLVELASEISSFARERLTRVALRGINPPESNLLLVGAGL